MEEYKYTDIANLIGGGTPKTTEASYWDGNIPWLSVKDFCGDQKYVYTTEKSITEKGLNNSSTKLLEKDDIIISARGTVGEMAMIPFEMAFNQSCFGIRAKKDKVLPDYLYYFTKTKVRELKQSAHGSVFDTITRETFESLTCKLPCLTEQKNIVSILSCLDSKIDLNRRINDNLEQQAQALFAEVFESDHTFTQLGAVIETCSGGTPSRNNLDYYIDGTICWVKSKELNRSFLFDTEEKIAQVGIDRSSAKLLPKNSVLIAMYGATVGEYCIIDKPMTCNQAICALLPSSDYPASYLYMFIKQKRNELINLAVGSAQQNISQVLIKGLSVSANLKLIAKFDKMVMPIFNMIRKNVKESIILEAERNTLLPRLMSGELKINDLNC